jgi:lipoyl(octanoyl) transferase
MIFEDWGLIDYEKALQKQLEYVEQVASDENHQGFLIFCTHPAVVTLGRQTKADDVFDWSGPVIEISRGGRATYHGPSQVVVYPIINLKKARKERGPQEVRGYLRALEKAIVETLKEFGVKDAVGKTPQKILGEQVETDETGVWIASQKIASLGIAVKKWVSFHGAAINVNFDANAFIGMNPCGFKSSTMISLEQVMNQKIDSQQFKKILKANCLNLL